LLNTIQRDSPVWCLEWNPVKVEQESYLAVGCWDQTLSFYDTSGA
jgi:intraflagellar transport protein 122